MKPKTKKKVIMGWGIYEKEFGLVHYLTDKEMFFSRTKKYATEEMKKSYKGEKIVRIKIIINP